VNPRIQVEHTVTEEITGIDLAASQFEIALGRSLRDLQLDQASVPEPRGIAIECRVNLEEVASDGIARATIGTLESFETPSGPGIRVDTGGFRSYLSTGKYDSLLAKVITSTSRGGLQRTAAMADAALAEFRVSGPGTNIGLLRAILQDPDFLHSVVTTTFVDDSAAELMPVEHAAPPANGDREVVARCGGTVVALPVAVGEHVAVGAPIVVLESMKMEHLVRAARSGTVDELLVDVGESIASGAVLVRITPDHIQEQAAVIDEVVDLNEIRPDLAEVVERQRLVLDAARPEAVARRRRTDQRTARENISDLCDEGEFSEYGGLVLAAQRQRRSVEDLITNTPADGIVAGVGHVNGHLAGPVASRCVVLAYDYTVLAGTQGVLSHRKTDRMLEIAAKQQLPVVLFSEGGGGRPGDTDTTMASGLDVTTFSAMGRLSGLVPTIGIVSGRCFAGNAALLGCCDLIIATRDATIGMGGPAMIEGGGLGKFLPADVGPTSIHVPNGVIDVLTDNEAQAVAVAKRYLSYFQGPARDWECADQRRLRHVVPPNRVRIYDIREAISLIADTDSVLELRSQFGVGIVTALIRVQGRPMGVVANDPAHLGGAIDTAAADKMARFLQLCDAHGLAVLSLCDTPGFMVGPDSERNASVRHFSRLFVIGANLTVPMVSVVLRKGYGLGAQAMAGGGFREPAMTLAWPTGEIGAMGIEGSVRLGYRRELNAVGDPEKRGVEFDRLVAEQYSKGKALNAAAVFELDDVIDPADTRRRIAGALPPASIRGTSRRRQYIDSW
jgi:acetyl-CoA carboxylase carboxyltransferase component/biotin carboxyl carrier protein